VPSWDGLPAYSLFVITLLYGPFRKGGNLPRLLVHELEDRPRLPLAASSPQQGRISPSRQARPAPFSALINCRLIRTRSAAFLHASFKDVCNPELLRDLVLIVRIALVFLGGSA
jgi:hypothetical protein